MSENHRGPEVPEVKVPAAECLDGFARITLEELAITHFVGTLQNACSTRPRVVVGLGKSAHSHIVRLMNNRQKRSKKNDDSADSKTFVMGSDAAKFVNNVKDQVRNRQKRMSNVAESSEEHSIMWGMFMVATFNAATFMGKNFSTLQSFIKSFEDLTLKQMFDVTAQLVNDQEEIHCMDKIHWSGDETVINLQSTKVYVFLQHLDSNDAWKNRIAGVKAEKSYRDYDAINGESTEFEWNIFPGFTTLQLCGKINNLLSDLGKTPETFTEKNIFMSMFNDISCDNRQ